MQASTDRTAVLEAKVDKAVVVLDDFVRAWAVPGAAETAGRFSALSAVLEEVRVAAEALAEEDREIGIVAADRDRYRSLFDAMPVACIVTDSLGVVVAANRRAASFLRSGLLPGAPLAASVAPDSRGAFRSRLLDIVRTGEPIRGLEVGLGLFGRWPRPAILDATADRDPHTGKIGTIHWIVRDRTPEERAEPRAVPLGGDAAVEALRDVLAVARVLREQLHADPAAVAPLLDRMIAFAERVVAPPERGGAAS